MNVSYEFPGCAVQIFEAIGDGEWLINNFDCSSGSELLNPAAYRYRIDFEGASYTVLIDLNIFQFLVNSLKKEKPQQLYREAVAYLAFFQIAGIEVDPTLAVYEKVNHQSMRAREGVEDLYIFREINNLPTELLALYATGKSDRLSRVKNKEWPDPFTIQNELTRYRRLTGWSSLYTIVLAVVRLEFDDSVPRREKLYSFVEWSFGSYRHSLPGFIFAVSVLGQERFGRTMKFSPDESVGMRKSAVENMTWDLFYMKQYFDRWVGRSTGEEVLFLTKDVALARMLRLSIDVQKAQSLQPLERYIAGCDRQIFSHVINPDSYPHERVFNSSRWCENYKLMVKTELEASLLGPN